MAGEETLLEFVEKIKALKVEGQKAMAVWSDFSQRWFTLLHSTRPFIFESLKDMADHVIYNCLIWLFPRFSQDY